MITSTSGPSRGNTPAKPRPAPAKPEFKKTVYKIETEDGVYISDCKEATLQAIVKYGKPVVLQLKEMTDQEYHSTVATNLSHAFFS